MIPNRRYRFFMVNLCDYAESYTSTYVGGGIIIGAHTFVAGDYAWFEGFDTPINGLHVITGTDPDRVYIDIGPDAVDTSILGTVNKLVKRYVDPLNFLNTKFVWEKQNDEIFFRKKLSGKLKFDNHIGNDKDFDYFLNHILSNPCCKVKFVVEKRCSELGFDDLRTEQNWNIDWEGYITHNMGKWNLSHCNVETDIEVDDEYTCLLDSKGEEVNVLDGTPLHTVSITQETGLEEFECCTHLSGVLMGLFSIDHGCGIEYDHTRGPSASTLLQHIVMGDCGKTIGTGIGGWGIKKLVVTIDPDNPGGHCIEGSEAVCLTGTFCITYIREWIYTFDIDGVPQQPSANGGNDWYNDSSSTIAGLPVTKWARNPSTTYDENDFSMDCSDYSNSLTFDYSDSIPDPTTTTYETGRYLSDAATLVARTNCKQINGIRSDFFEINPVGDTPGYAAGTNYVTGAQNKIKNLLLIHMSDYLNPTADQPAFIGNMTFEQLTQLWRVAFNAYWFVDDEGYIRVEHISWFSRAATVDTTTVANDNRHRNKSLKAFTFDRTETPIREEFTWQHQGNIDFVGFPIKYSSPCVNPKKVIKSDLTFISTDTTFLTFLTSIEERDGFVLIALDPDDNSQIDKEVGLLSTLDLNNAHLSWANLHYNYHRHDRWLLDGNMNRVDETFLSAKKTKRQVPIRFAGGCCAAINPLTDLITSELGDGQIDKMQKDNRDELYTFELLF